MNARKIITQAASIPAVSQAALHLLDLLKQPDVHNAEIVRAIRFDPVITAQLLRLCNSVRSASHDPIDSIEQATLRLGQQEILRLVLALNFGGTLSQQVPGYAIEARELWQHSLVTAFAAEDLARNISSITVEPSLAFTAGLLHDFGKHVLDYTLSPEIQTRIRDTIRQKNCSRLEAEQEILKTDHCEVAQELLGSWRLPEDIIEAVAHHHHPIIKPRPRLSAVIHVANCMAHVMGSAPGWEAYAVRVEEDVAEALGVQSQNMEQFLIAVHDSLRQVQQFLTVV